MATVNESTLQLISAATGALSVFGSLGLIFAYILFPSLKSTSRLLLTYLSIVDLGQGLFHTFGPYILARVGNCAVLTVFGIFFAEASFFWTLCIAYYMWRIILTPEANFSVILKMFHLLSWGYPTVFAVTLVIGAREAIQGDGNDVPWCFISSELDYLVWRVAAIFGPLIVSWTLTFLYYGLSWRTLRKLQNPSHDVSNGSFLEGAYERERYQLEIMSHSERLKEIERKMLWVPLMFLFLRLWDVLYRILELIYQSEQNFFERFQWLTVLTVTFNPSQGFFNFVVFVVFSSRFRNAYLDIFTRYCFRCQWRREPTLYRNQTKMLQSILS